MNKNNLIELNKLVDDILAGNRSVLARLAYCLLPPQ